ncbi:MAG: cell wall-associated protein wapA, partial [Pseudobdellovibrionaceae bacterium]
GFGWCSEFETNFIITPEGNIRLKECGGGQEILYSPREVTRKEIDRTISQIVSKIKAEGKVGQNADYFKRMSDELANDDEKRAFLARQYGVKIAINDGTKYMADGKQVEFFAKKQNIFERTLFDGTMERYEVVNDPLYGLKGRMILKYDKNKNYLKMTYDNDVLASIVDNGQKRMAFKYYSNKKVKEILGPFGVKADYKFHSNQDDLAAVTNQWRNTFTYEYDGLHNMTKATWPDKTFVTLKYDQKRDWVVGYQDRDKCNETYKYEFDEAAPRMHYWSTVKKVCGKETLAENRYEFWFGERDSQNYLKRVLSSVAGDTTDITYHDVFGKPISILKNNELTNFEYFPDGLPRSKYTKFMRMGFEYDSKTKKVSAVRTDFFDDKGKKTTTRNTAFKYDDRGNLVFARNTDGQAVTMSYDPQGRIASITDQAKKIVKIEYEERLGKPAIVTRPGLGTIRVSYKPNGEIAKVDSKEGASVAMQVASTFNNLLDIIAPATAELYL